MIFIKNFNYFYFLSVTILIILSNIIIVFQNSSSNSSDENVLSDYYFSNQEYFWPIPGFHNITSNFGPRISPTTGASSNHSGIDISAPENTNIYSITTGKVIFTGFQGANRMYYNGSKQ